MVKQSLYLNGGESRDRFQDFNYYGGEMGRPIPKKVATFYKKKNSNRNADLDFDS